MIHHIRLDDVVLYADHSFRLLQGLVLKCPYANVSAVLVDEVRSNAVKLWAALEETPSSRTLVEVAGRLVLHLRASAQCWSHETLRVGSMATA